MAGTTVAAVLAAEAAITVEDKRRLLLRMVEAAVREHDKMMATCLSNGIALTFSRLLFFLL